MDQNQNNLLKSSSSSVKFSIKVLMDESEPIVHEKKRVRLSRCIKKEKKDSIFRIFRTNRIMTRGTKPNVFNIILFYLYNVSNGDLNEEVSNVFPKKRSCSILEIQN